MADWFWDIVGVAGAPFTYGASLTLSPSARKLIKEIISTDSSSNNDNSKNTQALQEQWRVQNDQWKTTMEQNRTEIEKMRKERTEKKDKIKQNEETINSLKNKLNDPDVSDEEKTRIRKQIIVLEEDNKKLKQEIQRLKTKEEKKEKEKPTPPQAPVPFNTPTFPKLSTTDKLIIAGGITLVVYLLLSKSNRRE